MYVLREAENQGESGKRKIEVYRSIFACLQNHFEFLQKAQKSYY